MNSTLILTSKVASDSRRLLALAEGLATKGEQVGVLFVGDGVYSLVKDSESLATINKIGSSLRLFAAEQDVEARGLKGRVAHEAKVVDYDRMVKLIMREYGKVVSYL